MLKLSNKELVSVIIPTYNRADFIIKTLDSVLKQSYRPIEILIVDDGSKDNTKEVVEKWARFHKRDDFNLRYFKQKRAGAPVARNTGIKEAKGRYLQFLDSDDLLMPQKIKVQWEKLQQEQTPICICDYRQIDNEGKLIRVVSNNRTMKALLSEYLWLHTSVGLIDRTKFEKGMLRWNPKIKKLQDRDFYLKIFFLIKKYSYVEEQLFEWIRHDGERIFDSTPLTSGIYWTNLKSLYGFYLKNYFKIQPYKRPAIRLLLKKLYLHTKSGRLMSSWLMKVPEKLKIWRKPLFKAKKTKNK